MHLLVIEDDPRLGRLLVRLFSEDRHVVELADSGREGLEAADSGGSLDAIILDVGLPDLDGLEVARRIRARGCRTPSSINTQGSSRRRGPPGTARSSA